MRDVWIDADAVSYMLAMQPSSVRELLEGSPIQTLHCIGSAFYMRDARKAMEDAQYPKAVSDAVVFEDYPERYVCHLVTLVWGGR